MRSRRLQPRAAVGRHQGVRSTSHSQGTFLGSPRRRVRPARGVAHSHSLGYSQPRRGILGSPHSPCPTPTSVTSGYWAVQSGACAQYACRGTMNSTSPCRPAKPHLPRATQRRQWDRWPKWEGWKLWKEVRRMAFESAEVADRRRRGSGRCERRCRRRLTGRRERRCIRRCRRRDGGRCRC
jgi:hypothetical protein